MGSRVDFRCKPALAHLLQVATRQAMQTSRVPDPPLLNTLLPSELDSRYFRGYGPGVRFIDLDDDSFFSSEGDISVIPDIEQEHVKPLLFKDMVRRCAYSDKQVVMGKVFEQVLHFFMAYLLSSAISFIYLFLIVFRLFVYLFICLLVLPICWVTFFMWGWERIA